MLRRKIKLIKQIRRVKSASGSVIQREDLPFYYMGNKVTFKQRGEGH